MEALKYKLLRSTTSGVGKKLLNTLRAQIIAATRVVCKYYTNSKYEKKHYLVSEGA